RRPPPASAHPKSAARRRTGALAPYRSSTISLSLESRSAVASSLVLPAVLRQGLAHRAIGDAFRFFRDQVEKIRNRDDLGELAVRRRHDQRSDRAALHH